VLGTTGLEKREGKGFIANQMELNYTRNERKSISSGYIFPKIIWEAQSK
jgi:hypothetical protein